MPISFSCHQCGRSLKAPESAAGKSTKCPGCGATVTCPDAVYDAELLGAPSSGAAAYGVADRDLDGAYAMAGSPAGAAAGPDARRPCPMCGEMIIATAAKCRFCGEIFDATLKKSGLGGTKAKSMAAAQRNLMISILLWIACAGVSGSIRGTMRANPDPGLNLAILIVSVVGLAGYVGIACYIFILEKKMSGLGSGIAMGLFALLPCINLVLAFMLNQRVNKYFQENGYSVGLFGAKVP
jgi:predicted RNA-binding Zn-ribbon protein involved in translation (DUF1610 family)